jgi:hypothetical protein
VDIVSNDKVVVSCGLSSSDSSIEVVLCVLDERRRVVIVVIYSMSVSRIQSRNQVIRTGINIEVRNMIAEIGHILLAPRLRSAV